MASQASSAVAFSDRETAREVLRSIDADADVASVALFGNAGEMLYLRGTISARLPAVIDGPQMIDTATRLAASAWWSRSRVRARARDRAVDRLTARGSPPRPVARVLTGCAALAGGGLAAWRIAQRLARRLRAISTSPARWPRGI